MFQDGNHWLYIVLPPSVPVCIYVCVFPLSLQNALLYEHSK